MCREIARFVLQHLGNVRLIQPYNREIYLERSNIYALEWATQKREERRKKSIEWAANGSFFASIEQLFQQNNRETV